MSEPLYTVTQLAQDLGVTARTVRFYEDKGLLTPQRAGNNRVYNHRDRARLILILRGKRLGFSLREIKEYLDLYDADPTRQEQMRALLKKVQDRIDSLVEQERALAETLAELRSIAQQTETALAALPRRGRRARGRRSGPLRFLASPAKQSRDPPRPETALCSHWLRRHPRRRRGTSSRSRSSRLTPLRRCEGIHRRVSLDPIGHGLRFSSPRKRGEDVLHTYPSREDRMTDVVIAGYARSPFTPAKKGALARVRPDDLAAQVVRKLVADTGIPSKDIEDLIVGCAFPEGEQGFNVARLIGMLAGLDLNVGGVTVNRFCGSSMQSVHMAAGQIALGAGEAFLCAGVESMSRVPMMGFNPMPNPALHEQRPGAYIGMGDTAENVARRWEISRAEQEAFAVDSHRKAAAAQAQGRLSAEIVPITTKGGTVETDGCVRADASAEGLAALKPTFQQTGTVTAGTSSPLTDGASAVLVCSDAYARRARLTPLARVAAVAISGCEPEIMGIGPVAASKKAMARAGITADALSVVELNEAFAAQAIACIRDLGLDGTTVNIDGGAIALGHPLGATGARIVGKAASLLAREGGRFALATQCIGGGQGIATLLERV